MRDARELNPDEFRDALARILARQPLPEPQAAPPVVPVYGIDTGTTSSTAAPPPAAVSGRGALAMSEAEYNAGLRALGVKL